LIVSGFVMKLLLALRFLQSDLLHVREDGVLMVITRRVHVDLLLDLGAAVVLLQVRVFRPENSHSPWGLVDSVLA
jgi:hypothetical protein